MVVRYTESPATTSSTGSRVATPCTARRLGKREPLGRSIEIVRHDGRPLPKGRREFLTLVEPENT